ncbi:MAG: UDP-N-acetylmuramoyl-L-alanyl-D-glutamate--2,6-diaminopimelate ligase [Pseudomonadota bacterium]
MSMPAESINPGVSLAELFPRRDVPAASVCGITADSRRVEDGFLFLATGGATNHGLDFAAEAVRRGAAAIAWDPLAGAEPAADLAIPAFAVPDLGNLLGDVANRYYRNPSLDLDVYGVTGTNGKTTVAWFMARCAEALGRRCGYVGTLGSGLGDLRLASGLTTPDAVELHGLLADFRDAGATAAAVEVSSHALEQNRVDGVRFRAALFTNLSRDHLDYHGSMQAYGAAKAKLFFEHRPGVSIVNVDSEFGRTLAERIGKSAVAVSSNAAPGPAAARYLTASTLQATGTGSEVAVESSWGQGRFVLPVPGGFNVANALLAMAALLEDGLAMLDVCEAISTLPAPPGRLQRVPGSGVAVYVDFAHTPDALRQVLTALRPHTRGRLILAFGAGGDRDAGKRPAMGSVAEELADVVVLTSDNPRGEDPYAILEAIRGGFADSGKALLVEDREEAIAKAIALAAPGDAVLIAGKGHEAFQQLKDGKRSFSDAAVAERCLRAAAEARS